MALMLNACGGGGAGYSSTTQNSALNITTPLMTQNGLAENEVAVNVYSSGDSNPNQPLVDVTVCQPGSTTQCRTVQNVLLDTGSYGLRLFASDIGSVGLSQSTANGAPLSECVIFGTGFTWGGVYLADVKLGNLVASNIPIQSIQSSSGGIPTACSTQGVTQISQASQLGASGILGVGAFPNDCGSSCVTNNSGNSPPNYYTYANGFYSAPSSVPLSQQVINPVTALPSPYNDGHVIDFSATSATSEAIQGSGKLILGVGTATNNLVTAQNVIALDTRGEFTTYASNGARYLHSFIDSGSNGLFFSAPSNMSLSLCAYPNQQWYCPYTTVYSSASIQSNIAPHTSATVSFSVMTEQSGNYVQPGKAGTVISNNAGWDWGFPFFYARKVFTGISGQNPPGGQAPYVGF